MAPLPPTPTTSIALFDGVLVYDGAGFYPGLELLNLVFGVPDDQMLRSGDDLQFLKHGHEFARRLVWDEKTFHEEDLGRDVLVGDRTPDVLRELLRTLQLPIPNVFGTPTWERAHFFPYSRSLVHWDARLRGGKISVERRYLRGGGALAHRVLRSDPDVARLEAVRDGFRKLLPSDARTALDRLAHVLRQHATPRMAAPDDVERDCKPRSPNPMDDAYRDGVRNILGHLDLSTTARVRALITWSGFWLACRQYMDACRHLRLAPSPLVVDCGSGASQVRRESRRCVQTAVSRIGEAAESYAKREGLVLPRRGRKDLEGFFWATCAAIGLINAFKGRKHFQLKLNLAEALVLANVSQGAELALADFTLDRLFGVWNLIVSRPSAERAGAVVQTDASLFEDNEKGLAEQMSAAGLLTTYSDQTRMISTGGIL